MGFIIFGILALCIFVLPVVGWWLIIWAEVMRAAEAKKVEEDLRSL